VSDVSEASDVTTADDAAAGAGAAASGLATRFAALPMCVLGALLLVGALDPARWPDYLSPQWFFGALALLAGFWAGAPVVDRPVMPSYRLRHQLLRHRNTLLVAVSALLAALQNPPVWLMVVEVPLLLTYLALIDAGSPPARPANQQLSHAACAYAASALVLLAALAPVTGGWWGRIVAALAVLGTLGLLLAALRLRQPANYPRAATADDALAGIRRH
jgi:hypothetical protein